MTSSYQDRIAMISAFIRTRWGLRFKTRQELLEFQARHINRFLKRSAGQSDFYRLTAHLALDQQPVVDKKTVLNAFPAFNAWRIDLVQARTVAFRAEREREFGPTLPGGLTVGSSSGTSGEPSIFLVSTREQSIWAGVILARMLTTPILCRILNPFARPVRIAFFLRANSNLYQTLGSSRVQFKFFDLLHPLEMHAVTLFLFLPDILIAPPSVLYALALMQIEGDLDIRPGQVISVAETLEIGDVSAIQSAWSTLPRQIYQCTEGFLGYSCAHGSIHLNEEFVQVELESLSANDDRFTAIITDFSRNTQLFIRYRMDDVLHVNSIPCACGRITLCLKAIEGRRDEVLWLPDLVTGTLKPVFPDQLRRAMMLAAPFIDDYRIEQHGLTLRIALSPAPGLDDAVARAQVERELETVWQALALRPPNLMSLDFLAAGRLDKRRRIRCVGRPLETNGAEIENAVHVGVPE